MATCQWRRRYASDALRRAGLISIIKSEGEAGAGSLHMTDLGKTRLRELNAKLFAILKTGLKGEERSIARANKGLKVLSRAIMPPKKP